MTRWARGGVLAAVMTLGVLATEGESAAFSRDRDFRSCFIFDLGILGDVEAVLQLAGERGPALEIVGVVQFETPGGPSLPVAGVARRRADGDLDVHFSFLLIEGTIRVVIHIGGRLSGPNFNSGSGAFVSLRGGFTDDGPLTFTPCLTVS